MLFVKVATCFSLIWFVNCALNYNLIENDFLGSSVESLMRRVCENAANCNSGLDVIVTAENHAVDDRVTEIISKTTLAVQIESKIKDLHEHERRRFFAIVFIDDLASFNRFYSQLKFKNFYPNGIFIIIFETASNTEMKLIFKLLWKKFVHNVNILTQTPGGLIEMFTFMPFGKAGKCDDESPVKINEFERKSMRWLTNNYFPKKFKNLQKCSIRCGLFKLVPVNIIDHFPNGSIHLRGFDVDVFTELMNSVNAKVNFTVYPIDTGKIFPNGSASGLLGQMIKGNVDASTRSWSLQLDRRKVLTETTSYFSDKLVLIMPLPVALNPLMKFIRPLGSEVWFAVFGLVFVAAIAIWVFKIIPKRFHERIIGKPLRNEFLNILIGFIGLSQTSLPEKNFPRFLLMMFLIFCLIVRSLYLGSLFNMLKSEIRSKEFTTISDFYNAGFDFYMYDSLSQRLDYPLINSR